MPDSHDDNSMATLRRNIRKAEVLVKLQQSQERLKRLMARFEKVRAKIETQRSTRPW